MIFKIALIILIAAPVVGISFWLYLQLVALVRDRNRREKARRR